MNLDYRNHISVHLTIDTKLFDDNWIYIHSPDLEMARISDFTNKINEQFRFIPLTLEYFLFESSDIWTDDDESIINFATEN